jgi:hypothetical protein
MAHSERRICVDLNLSRSSQESGSFFEKKEPKKLLIPVGYSGPTGLAHEVTGRPRAARAKWLKKRLLKFAFLDFLK